VRGRVTHDTDSENMAGDQRANAKQTQRAATQQAHSQTHTFTHYYESSRLQAFPQGDVFTGLLINTWLCYIVKLLCFIKYSRLVNKQQSAVLNRLKKNCIKKLGSDT